jgi:mono/diheme cytochrome c family protein
MSRRLPLFLLLAAAPFVVFAARQRIAAHPKPEPVVNGPTYNNEVSRIFQAHCESCHHPGDIAPFSLMTYTEAAGRADSIKFMTRTKQMPPWKPVDGCGTFNQPRVLSAAEIDTIGKWVDNGAPEGNPADLPQPLSFDSGWVLGQPDLVLSYPEAYTPPATGDMYRCFPIPTQLAQDQYVSAIDIHPGNRGEVHHVIAYIDTNGSSQALDDNDAGPGYTSFGGPGFSVTNVNAATLGGWAPGSRPIQLPDGIAYSLPAASRVVLQVHYHPHAQVTPDRTEIGIYFAKTKPKQLLRVIPLINQDFTIPPNAANYLVTASLPIPTPVPTHLWLIAPHMHLLGRKMNVTAAMPNGSYSCLINIDDWDFNWQGLYRFENAVALPTGTRLSLGAYYDNSTDNWRNPNTPPKAVSWGESTTDEMCIAFLGLTIDGENLTSGKTADVSWLQKIVAAQR